jgi:hypothetical protein
VYIHSVQTQSPHSGNSVDNGTSKRCKIIYGGTSGCHSAVKQEVCGLYRFKRKIMSYSIPKDEEIMFLQNLVGLYSQKTERCNNPEDH